jgi:glycosyltransferase involved in cell wall biosynthesis
MTIWLISKYASPQKYYFGTRHFYLAEEWVKLGHDVSIFTSNSSHLSNQLPKFKSKVFFEIINGIKTYWLNTVRSKSSSGMSRIFGWLHFEWQLATLSTKDISKPDVVIVSSLSLLSVLNGYRYAKKYGSKFVFEVRDIWPLSAVELGNFSPANPLIYLLSLIEKFGYKNADVIVGTIPNLKEHVETVIGKTDKCFCIPQGINLDFYAEQEKLSDDYINTNIPRNKFMVIYAGTINANNPLQVMLEAAKILKESPVHFMIVGEGNQKMSLMERAKDISNVSFPPSVNKNQVNHLLSFASVCFDCFSSSLARYGLSRNKWIDYMYAGKPIICSYSGFQSMINECDAGSFVSYNDEKALASEILRYLNFSKDELEAMGKRAQNFVIENRTFPILAKKYLHLFVE